MSAIDVLYRVPIFVDLRDDELQEMALQLRKRTFAKGMILFHKTKAAQVNHST